MTDREKVIKGLECRKNAEMRCGNPCEETGNCKYATLIRDPSGEPYYPYICDRKKLCEDAIALLKEEEAKQIVRRQAMREHSDGLIDYFAQWYCPHCNLLLTQGFATPQIKYCYKCGKAVKWE